MTTVRYTADAVVFAPVDDELRVLLVRRAADHDTEPGRWALPGGHVEPDETGESAAYRELDEETGLDLRKHAAGLTLVGVFDAPGRDPRGRYVSAAYTTRLPSPVPVLGQDDADAAEWMPVDAALSVGLAFDHADILRAALSRAASRS